MTGVSWGSRLKSIVPRTRLEDDLGLHTVGDLLRHYPRTYLKLDEVSSAEALVAGELVMVVAQVESLESKPYVDRRTRKTAYRTEVSARLGGTRIWMTFFDPHKGRLEWRAKQLPVGGNVLLAGRFEQNQYKRDRWELTHPEIDEVEVLGALKPVYPAAGKVTSGKVERAVRVVLDVVEEAPDPIPSAVRDEQGLLDADTAIRWIHRPRDWQQVGAAMKRLRFEEAFVAQVALAQRRHEQRRVRALPRTGRPGGIFDAFDARLPFELTAGQHQVEKEILDDLAADHPMHRLLQGEVGSGKTVVALRAMLRVVDSGGQAALLAPTEVLAQQHLRSLTAMLGDLAVAGQLGAASEATSVALLTGSQPAAHRRRALLQAASGEAGIVIGTHALLEEHVQFADLGLVVVDEQHRFGVEQRAALAAKTTDARPHELVMTATPIPRTVAMTVFGDLETSSLRELPAGRSPIQSTVVPLEEQPGWFDRIWARVREEVERGRQVYVVCPRITSEGDEKAASEPGEELLDEDEQQPKGRSGRTRATPAAVEDVTPWLADGPLSGCRVAMLHGRLTPEAKDEAMRTFAAGDSDVLVATTVIEVGVDVPNATTMVVLDADRFGVSQLHQLRGRVGRGSHPGLCLLVSRASEGSTARERLEAVAATLDGFELAELDLGLRREGDVLGARQSGSTGFKLLSVLRDVATIEAARTAAGDLVDRDPALQAQPAALQAAIAELDETARAEFLDKA
ncbi:MAG: ATP-dependent helicase RecG [Nocardioidaceae bacterium]|nr:ATP-dependent helicase RecG [Nocardioidaceae bacterium]